MATGDRSGGAVRLGGKDRGTGPGMVGWLLLALLLIALVVGLLVLLLGGGDDKNQAAAERPVPTVNAPSPAGSDGGTLVAAEESLLPAADGAFAALVGQEATGTKVVVQSVNGDAGFWVGTSAQDRVYIEYGAETGGDEVDGYTPKAGDRVDLTGEARPAPRDPPTALNVDAAGARLIEAQGGFVNADSVQQAQ